MDSYEATRIVFSRITNLDPENASKIMGLLLIQDHGEKEMIRLAFGPEAFLHSVILKARKDLGLMPISNSPSTPSTPSPPSPYLSTNPTPLSRQNSTSRLSLTIPNPSSSAANWAALSSELRNQEESMMMSPNNMALNCSSSSSSSMMNSSLPFFGNGGPDHVLDEFQLQEQLSFLNDGAPNLGPKSPDLFYPQPDLSSSPTNGSDQTLFSSYGGSANWGGGSLHRRSCSVSDACLEDPNSGFGWKPCLYFARGYCKNGASCRFLHGGGLGDLGSDGAQIVGSPSKLEMMDQSCHEALLRSKTAQQQRLAAASQLMASANSFPYSSKCMNFLLQQQQQQTDAQRYITALCEPTNSYYLFLLLILSCILCNRAAAALMMGDDIHKFSRSPRLERNEFPMMNGGAGIVNPASRQIYLTFPADSTFREEDVSNYFRLLFS